MQRERMKERKVAIEFTVFVRLHMRSRPHLYALPKSLVSFCLFLLFRKKYNKINKGNFKLFLLLYYYYLV